MKNSLLGCDALNSGKYVPTLKIDLFPLSPKQTRETVGSSPTAVRTYRNFRYHITDIGNHHSLSHENLRNKKFKKSPCECNMTIIAHSHLQKFGALFKSILCFSPSSSNSATIEGLWIAQSVGAKASVLAKALKRLTTHAEMHVGL